MGRNWDLTEVWDFFRLWLWWKRKVGWDHLEAFFLWLAHCVLHNDLVHRPVEVELDFKEDTVCVNLLLAFQLTGCQCHLEDASALLSVKVS